MQVVQRIRASPDETRLLVLSADAERYYRQAEVVVTGQMPNVEFRSSASVQADGAVRPNSAHNRFGFWEKIKKSSLLLLWEI